MRSHTGAAIKRHVFRELRRLSLGGKFGDDESAIDIEDRRCPREVSVLQKWAALKRDYADFVDVVDLQISKSKDMFTINVGVADKFVLHACWGIDGSDMVEEHHLRFARAWASCYTEETFGGTSG